MLLPRHEHVRSQALVALLGSTAQRQEEETRFRAAANGAWPRFFPDFRLSEVSRQSLERIGSTLCGYPQLASEARYAAGQIGHMARRLLLGEEIPPWIGNLDLDELLPRAGPRP